MLAAAALAVTLAVATALAEVTADAPSGLGGGPPPPPPPLAQDDECLAAEGGSAVAARGAHCGLSALQRRGQRLPGDAAPAAATLAVASRPALRRVQAPQRLRWAKVRVAEYGLLHELVFDTKPRHQGRLHQLLLERSTPGSPLFRQWLSQEDALAAIRNDAAMAAARSVLEGIGASSLREVGGVFLHASAPVSVWRRLLSAEFAVFRRNGSMWKETVRADSYLMPDSLVDHVDGILNLLDLDESREPPRGPLRHPKSLFGNESGVRLAQGAVSTCDQEGHCDSFEEFTNLWQGKVITPPKLREYYNMPPVAQRGSAQQIMRSWTTHLVFASGQYWSPSDRLAFQQTFGLPEMAVREVDGKYMVASDAWCWSYPSQCDEANLDVQYLNAMSPWSQILLSYQPDGSFSNWINSLLLLNPVPHVVSISYGVPESTVAQAEHNAFEKVMATLGVQGGTVVVASGDDGAYDYSSSSSMQTSAARCALGTSVSWPASSIYVTGVGATMGAEAGSWEVAAQAPLSGITSGGGYSRLSAKPAWQSQWVTAGTTRGVPDLALAGHAYATRVGGRWSMADGTSASAPTFAGMVSLINAMQLDRGAGTVGFLNPVLYQNAAAFRDITQGDNRCGKLGAACCQTGWSAGVGWDPVTGLGSPDFGKLFQAITGYQASL